jgi:hypothetical protein
MSENITCSGVVDYSTQTGDKILPYRIVLNTQESVLYPTKDEKQKFCYEIVGVGDDDSRYEDLGRILFGICPEITENDFAEVSVVLNEKDQVLVWGANIEMDTVESADTDRGCVGLKIFVPVERQNGVMKISFTMNHPYSVGLIDVCLFGEDTVATGQSICGPVCEEPGISCTTTFYQKETVCVPVHVRPYAIPGVARATCCKTPVVARGNVCTGNQTSCSFTVTQELCIAVPISFGAEIETSDAVVECGGVSEEGCGCSGESESGARKLR